MEFKKWTNEKIESWSNAESQGPRESKLTAPVEFNSQKVKACSGASCNGNGDCTLQS